MGSPLQYVSVSTGTGLGLEGKVKYFGAGGDEGIAAGNQIPLNM
jgi:hypothetical protein